MIIPGYNAQDITYYFDYDDKGLQHSYPKEPPGYSSPQILYTFHFDGIVSRLPGPKIYNWEVSPPFYILSGQTTTDITCELIPKLITDREPIITGARKIEYRDIKFSELNLTCGKWKETLNLYYKQGPLWKINGNRTPKVQTVETYELVPQYNQTGFPPKNSTDPNSYSFVVKNGKVMKFHGGIPPIGNPLVDILWYSTGPSYLSFYSTWSNEKIKFPNTLDIIVKI